MKIHLLHLCIQLCIAVMVLAGSSDAVISGTTSSGRTQLTVLVSDISGTVSQVALSIDGESYTFEPTEESVIHDPEHGIYIIIAKAKDKVFTMWMIPNSEKILTEKAHHYRSKFGAIIEATDPRSKHHGKNTPRITIGCTLNYQI